MFTYIIYNYLQLQLNYFLSSVFTQLWRILWRWFSAGSTVKTFGVETSVKRQQIFFKNFFRESGY